MAFVLPLVVLGVVGLVVLLRPWPFFLARDKSLDPVEETNERNIAWGFVKWVERQARARGLSVRGVARSVPVQCPKCQKTSNYFVYPDELCERCWRATLKPLPKQVKDSRS